MFFALFKDGEGKDQEAEITEEVYLELLQQTREDDARLRWEKRHVDDGTDVDTFYNRSADVHYRIVEESVITAMLVDNNSLARTVVTDLQWRRLELHFCLGLTLEEIAELDGCTKMGVKNTIMRAIKNLKKIL